MGPDHPTTLWAAAAVTRALRELGDAELARAWVRRPLSAAAGCSASTTSSRCGHPRPCPMPRSIWARPSRPAPWARTPCSAAAGRSASTTRPVAQAGRPRTGCVVDPRPMTRPRRRHEPPAPTAG
ncbi:hypothetical protein [Geodermatophilus sp. URMC 60]